MMFWLGKYNLFHVQSTDFFDKSSKALIEKNDFTLFLIRDFINVFPIYLGVRFFFVTMDTATKKRK